MTIKEKISKESLEAKCDVCFTKGALYGAKLILESEDVQAMFKALVVEKQFLSMREMTPSSIWHEERV